MRGGYRMKLFGLDWMVVVEYHGWIFLHLNGWTDRGYIYHDLFFFLGEIADA